MYESMGCSGDDECLDEAREDALERHMSRRERELCDAFGLIGLNPSRHETFVAADILERLEVGDTDGTLDDLCEGGLLRFEREVVADALDLLQDLGRVRVSVRSGSAIMSLRGLPTCR